MPDVRITKIKSISRGTKQNVYDIGVEKNHNFFANGHVVSNCFQEQFMLLAQQLAGFTPGEADAMRKTLVKKDLTSLGKKAAEKIALEEKFIEGCVTFGNFDRDKAKVLFDKIAFFSLYGFVKAHAVSYAVDSYYGAWLSTYYPKHWLATVLQSENGGSGITEVINEIKAMGYEFAKMDINYSGAEWVFSEKIQAFVPPLSSVKGVGRKAVDEIVSLRPFQSLDDMLYDENGHWRLSKVNKACLDALCKIEAFDSLQEVEDGEVLNYNQLHKALVADGAYYLAKRGRFGVTSAAAKKAVKSGEELVPFVKQQLEKFAEVEDWGRAEKIKSYYELTSSADASLMFPKKLMKTLQDKDVQRLLDIPPKTEGVGWFCIEEVVRKTTKNGKAFLRCRIVDDMSRQASLRVWSPSKDPIEPYTIWLATAHNDPEWGFATSMYKMRQVM